MLGVNHSVRSPNRTGTDALIRDYDFIRKDKLHQDIEFDRDSGATQTSSSGLVAYAPENELKRSTQLASWVELGSNNVTVTAATDITDPLGGNGAFRVTTDTANVGGIYVGDPDQSKIDGVSVSSIYIRSVSGTQTTNVIHHNTVSSGLVTITEEWQRVVIPYDASVFGSVNFYAVDFRNSATDATDVYIFAPQLNKSFTEEACEHLPTTSDFVYKERFDYTKDGDKKGLLIEEVRTNLQPNSNSYTGTSQDKLNIETPVNNFAISPSGARDAVRYECTSTGSAARHEIYTRAAETSGTTYTESVYVKPFGSVTRVIGSEGGGTSTAACFDLTTGQIVSVSGLSATNSSITDCGNGWYRVSVTYVSPATNADNYFYWALGDEASTATSSAVFSSFNPSKGNGVYFWGNQREAGSFPTSLIPTYGATASRSGDVVKVDGTNFSRFFRDTEGTFAIDIQMPKGWEAVSGWPYFLQASANGSNSNRINFYGRPSQNYLSGHIQSGSEVDVNLSTNSTIALDNGEISRHAIAYKEDDGRYSGDGDVFTVTDTSVTLPVGINRLDIGQYYNGVLQMSGWFRRLRYYNKRKSDAQIQKLTDTSFLLDKFKGAKAAHSLRSLRDGRDNSPVTRIRREYDSFEADYTANQVANGDLEKDFRSAEQKTLPLNISCEADEMIVGGDFTNIVTNGTFDTDTSGWAAGGGATLAIDSNRLKITNDASGNSYASQTLTTVVGRTYTVSVDYTDDTGSNALIWVGTSFGGNQLGSTSFTATGNYTLTFTATSTTSYLRIGANEPTNGTIYFFDNVSVVEGEWTISTASGVTADFSNSTLRVQKDAGISNTHGVQQQIPAKPFTKYKVTVDVVDTTTSLGRVYLGHSGDRDAYSNNSSLAVGSYSYDVTTGNFTNLQIRLGTSVGTSGAGDISFDNVSVKEVNPIGTGFSTRKINSSYNGYAMRVRNFDDSTEAEVSFDSNDEISLDSPVKATSMNLVGHSENFGSWVASSVDLTSGQSDPFGGNNAYIIKSQSAGSNQAYLGSISLTSGNYYTLSVYLKPLDTTRTRIFVGGGGATNQGFDVSFSSLGVPSTVSSTGATNITYTPVGTDGWYRVSGVIKSDATTSNSLFIIYPDYSGNTKSVYAFGAQLEETVYESTGTELVTNGDFSTSDSSANGIADWLTTSGAGIPDDGTGTTLVNGKLRFDNTMATGTSSDFLQIFQRVDVVAGRKYSFSGDFDILGGTISGGGVNAILLEDSSPFASRVNFGPATADGTVTGDHVATITETVRMRLDRKFVNGGTDNDVVADIDNISLVEYSPKVSDYVQTPVISDAHNSTSATNLREFAGKENLLTYNEDFLQGSWNGFFGSTTTASNITDPFGGTGAYLVTENSENTQHAVIRNSRPTLLAGTHTHSCYVKSNGRNVVRLWNNGTSGAAGASFDLTTGQFALFSNATSASIETLSDGWYRISLTFTNVTGNTGPSIYGMPSLNGSSYYQGDGTSGFYLFGFQTNTNGLKDYQKTTGAPKRADVHVVTWYDQGGGEDFTQSTTDYQPRLVMGSELVTDSGGKASVYFDDADHLDNDSLAGHNRLDSYYLTDSTDDIYALPSGRSGAYVGALFDDGDTSNNWYLSAYATAQSKIHINGTELSGTSRDDLHDQSKGHSLVTHENVYTKSWPNFEVGVWTAGPAWNFTGKISEAIFFPNMDSSPKRFPIEQNMMNHYIPNLLTNGDFSDGLTGWVAGGDSSLISVENGAIRINSPDSTFTQIYQTVPVTLGRKYVITADLVVTSGGVAIGANHNSAATEVTYTSSGSISQSFVATTTSSSNTIYIKRSGASNVLIDNVKVQEVGTSGYLTTLYDQTGNNCHATQSTATEQPQLVSGGDLIKSGGHPAWEYPSGNPQRNLRVQGVEGVSTLDAFFVAETSDAALGYPVDPSVGYRYGLVAEDSSTNTTLSSSYGSPVLEINGVQQSPSTRDDVHTAYQGRKLVYHRSASTSLWENVDMGHFAGITNYSLNIENTKFSEWIWYDSDQHSNQSGIESNINTHYNIYS